MRNSRAFINGKIFTSDDNNPYAESMIVENGMIKWVGKTEDIPDDDFDVTDLQGRCVLPGFIDAHMHAGMLAEQSIQISCLPPLIHSIEELSDSIKKLRREQGQGKWIRGWGYDEGKMEEKRLINRYDLDEACDDSPVAITRTCAHIMMVNSVALKLAGIDRNTPDPQGGRIDRDENGEPVGILRENAKELVSSIIPVMSDEEMEAAVLAVGELLSSQGITSATDMGSLEGKDHYDSFIKASAAGFRQRMALYYIWDFFGDKPEYVSDRIKKSRGGRISAAGLKLLADGSVSGRTAWRDIPYLGSDEDCGMPVCTDELLDSAIDFCRENKCQLSVHAMGTRAIERIVERVGKEDSWTADCVPFARVEHVTEPSEKAIDIAAEKGIMFVTQPNFLYAEIESYIRNLGIHRLRRTYPVKHMLQKGVKLAFSTDAPATAWAVPSDPLPCIKFAVTRCAYDGTDCGRDEAVDIETAVKLYTRFSAEAAGFEKVGQLRKGFYADFIVLDRDIMTETPENIDEIKVLETYINGEAVYIRK